jgi:putative endonuclease
MSYYVYLTTTKNNTAIYTGVTNNLKRRIAEHKSGKLTGFTQKYHVDKLVYYEIYDRVVAAIAREKQIKAGSRQKKIDLIRRMNRFWSDLSTQI